MNTSHELIEQFSENLFKEFIANRNDIQKEEVEVWHHAFRCGISFTEQFHSDDNEERDAINFVSRRDQFAMAALSGGLEQGVEHDMASDGNRAAWWHSASKIAKRAYAIADAMLDEGDKL